MKDLISRSAIAAAVLGANQALAGGLWLNEFGDFAAGRASAGVEAGTDEASGIIQNPAGGLRLQGSQLFMSAGVLVPAVEFEVEEAHPLVGEDDGGDAGVLTPGAAMAYVHDLDSDKWSVGAWLGGLAGAGLDYRDEWVGRYQTTDVSIVLMVLGTPVSYQLTDKLAIGVTPQLYYSELELDVNLPPMVGPGPEDKRMELDGDDTGFSYQVGAIYEFTKATRLGIAYQSEIDIEYGGDLKVRAGIVEIPLSLAAETDTELTMAQKLRIGLHHQLNDQFGLDFTVGWEEWSALDQVFVSVDGGQGGGQGLSKNWDDTYHYAAGFQYKVDDSWDLTAGIAYDTNPVDSEDRTADLPTDRQMRYNLGLRKAISDTMTVGGFVNYTDLGSAKIDAPLWSGEYDTNRMFQFSMFLNWKL